MALCPRNATAACRAPHKVHAGLPREARCGLLFRLRGRPPACHRRGRSPLNQPTSHHADGATLGRWDANASQRTRRPGIRDSVRGSNQKSTSAQVPALSRKRPAYFNTPDGQAGSPPPQCPQNLAWNQDETDQDTSKTPPHRGAGYAIVQEPPSGSAPRCAQWRYRAPSGKPLGSVCSGSVAGRRRAIGVVVVLPINPRATTPMVRRWAAETP